MAISCWLAWKWSDGVLTVAATDRLSMAVTARGRLSEFRAGCLRSGCFRAGWVGDRDYAPSAPCARGPSRSPSATTHTCAGHGLAETNRRASAASTSPPPLTAEEAADRGARTEGAVRRCGPYLSERQWAPCARTTVRPDPPGTTFPTITRARAPTAGARTASRHLRRPPAALLRVGAVERRDPIIKERMFGLTGPRAITART
jgi:hypothetical protein